MMNAKISKADDMLFIHITQTRLIETYDFMKMWEKITEDGDYPIKVLFNSKDDGFSMRIPLDMRATRISEGK